MVENKPVPYKSSVPIDAFEEAVDDDSNSSICYRLLDNHNHTFTIVDARKPELSIRRSLDREAISRYNLTIIAEDCQQQGENGTAKCHLEEHKNVGEPTKIVVVNVEDVNDNLPVFERRYFVIFIGHH